MLENVLDAPHALSHVLFSALNIRMESRSSLRNANHAVYVSAFAPAINGTHKKWKNTFSVGNTAGTNRLEFSAV